MIEKLSVQEIETSTGSEYTITERIPATQEQIHDKINELVDAVNSLRDDCNLLMGYIAPEDKCEPAENRQSAKIAHPDDPYNEQRWVGCLCKLWTGDGLVRYGILRGVALNRKKTNYPYQALSTSFEHCEPVKPDDDIIFKGK